MTAVESANPIKIPVQIPQRESHDVLVGVGILDELPRYIEWLGLSKEILIISSPTIFGLYGEQLVTTLQEYPIRVTCPYEPHGSRDRLYRPVDGSGVDIVALR